MGIRTDRRIKREIDKQTDKQADGRTDEQTDIRVYVLAGEKTDRQSENRWTYMFSSKIINIVLYQIG